MSLTRTSRRLIIGLVAAALVTVAAATANAAPLAALSNNNCPALVFVGARGSGQSDSGNHGFGPEVNTAFESFKQAVGGRVVVRNLAVIYTAASVDVLTKLDPYEKALLGLALAPTPVAFPAAQEFAVDYTIRHLNPYLASINDGITSAISQMRAVAGGCTQARFVLGGYSQGAMVMHQVLLRLQSDRGFSSRIAGAILIGDGDRHRNTVARHSGSAANSAEGVRSALSIGERDIPADKASTTWEVCNDNDIVCDFHLATLRNPGPAKQVHESYKDSTLVKQTATSLARTVLG